MFLGNFHGFNTYDIETPKKPQLLASVVCPGGQGDMSVYGNLLFMSVEQTRGRVDCGTQGVTDAVSSGAFPRRAHLRHHRHHQAEAGRGRSRAAAARTRTRSSSIRTTRRTSTSTARAPAPVRSGDELDGCSNKGPKEDPNTALFSIDVIKVPLGGAREGGDRQPAAHLRRSGDRRDRRPVAGRQSRRGHADARAHQPVPRHHRVPGGRPRGRRLLGQRHPARHLGSGASDAPRPGRRQELRLLALGDVQQRRHEGRSSPTSGAAARARAAARPIRRPGAPTPSSTSSTRS